MAVGRKNWLFWGSDASGRTATVLTSLTATCSRHGLDPWAYLSDALARLPSHPADRIDELLPDTWAAARPTADTTTANPGSAPHAASSSTRRDSGSHTHSAGRSGREQSSNSSRGVVGPAAVTGARVARSGITSRPAPA